jgi:hypothetical protein
MNKFIVLLLVAVSLFISLSFNSKATANKNLFVFNNPTATPTPKLSAEIQTVNLDRDEVIIPCPVGDSIRENPYCKDDMRVNIRATAKSLNNSEFDYYYTVSGGKIIGRGANVIWDLTGVRYGDYTVTVQVGHEYQFSDKTLSKTVKVYECNHCSIICICPTVSVSGGGQVRAGETLDFEAHISNGDIETFTFNWAVSQGEIIAGQGKSKIRVKTTSEMIGTVKATVEISSANFCQPCRPTASETADVVK